jgi:ATP-dependent exoDNAse (exonuclease V) alpha subunit
MSLPVIADADNDVFQKAVAFVRDTGENLFLTGKAGTGKTTFLKYIRANIQKQCAVVAPTGVAAMNAGGETMHSFLQLPLSPFIPGTKRGFGGLGEVAEDKHSLIAKLRLNATKTKILRKLELLIVDEVSMVRCDTMDAMDLVLRHVRKNWSRPFGGVQMVFIGDLFQLPPVARDEDWNILRNYYASSFFFDSQVLKDNMPVYIELKKIYRQKEQQFIDILNHIRTGKANEDDIAVLNRNYDPGFNPLEEQGYITLSTHNKNVDAMNAEALRRLETRSHFFDGKLEGDFDAKNLPTDLRLQLKKGAQVMFIKNDMKTPRRYYNGKIGIVSSIDDLGVFVSFPDDPDTDPVLLEQDVWKNVRYRFNTMHGRIDEEEVGAFSQLPVKLAWAITVHKSQGLTFKKAVLDLSRSFASGQVYVALSRCTSLDGLVLRSPLMLQNIMVDEQITGFSRYELGADQLEEQLQQSRRLALRDKLYKLFSFTEEIAETEALQEDLQKRKTGPKEQNMKTIWALLTELEKAQAHADKFHGEIQKLTEQANWSKLRERKHDAAAYFCGKVLTSCIEQVKQHIVYIKEYPKVAKQLKAWKQLLEVLQQKSKQISEFNF